VIKILFRIIKKIFQPIIIIYKFFKRHLKLNRLILLINLAVATSVLVFFLNASTILQDLESKISIFHIYFTQELEDLAQTLADVGFLALENDKKQITITQDILKVIEGIQDNIIKLADIQKKFQRKLLTLKSINLKDVKKIKKANFVILNTTANRGGSGSHIKIRNKSYILTCAHLLKNNDDKIWAITDKGEFLVLDLIKIEYENDLALLRILKGMKNYPSLEISNEFPEEGSEIIVIGNPSSLTDVITDGIISKVEKKNYIFTNKIYFGNSGGAILYKGKIVGVTSFVTVKCNFPVFVNYGAGVNLKTIKRFLEDIK